MLPGGPRQLLVGASESTYLTANGYAGLILQLYGRTALSIRIAVLYSPYYRRSLRKEKFAAVSGVHFSLARARKDDGEPLYHLCYLVIKRRF